MPVFYLGALRDAADEFSSRSQFWGRLLKAIEIPPTLEAKAQRVLDLLNSKLLAADPKLSSVADTLAGTTRIAAQDQDGAVDLRLVPLKAWDILARAEIILRNEPDRPWLPLARHGQGIQSLAVILLFQAFIDHLLPELYEPGSTPILTLEEPETHLHPQAARTLWLHIQRLPGQKLITTHSPYFVQHVPFRDIRLVRTTDDGTEVRWLPPSFSARVPYVPALDPIIARSGGLAAFEPASSTLTIFSNLTGYSERVLGSFKAFLPKKHRRNEFDVRERRTCLFRGRWGMSVEKGSGHAETYKSYLCFEPCGGCSAPWWGIRSRRRDDTSRIVARRRHRAVDGRYLH